MQRLREVGQSKQMGLKLRSGVEKAGMGVGRQ